MAAAADPQLTRVALVEDHLLVALLVAERIGRLRGPQGQTARLVVPLDHGDALTWSGWGDVDVLLLDAYRHDSIHRVDPAASLFAGLHVADRAHRANPGLRIVGYSADARSPEVNIPFRQVDGVAALYDATDLVDCLAQALWSTTFDHGVPPPGPAEYGELGVADGAQVWEAIQAMRKVQRRDRFAHGDAWERVACTQPTHKIEPRTTEYIKDQVGPLLGITDGHGRHRRITAVIQRVVRLPARP